MAAKKSVASNENLIHIKLERGEALESKRDVLASQIALLKILKKVNAYRAYRTKELELKIELHKKMVGLKTNLKSLEKTLPKLKIPKTLNKEEEQQEKNIRTTEVGDLSIEAQLQEIQRKLEELQRR